MNKKVNKEKIASKNEIILIVNMLRKLGADDPNNNKNTTQNQKHDHQNTSYKGLEIKSQENRSQNKGTTKSIMKTKT